MRGFKPEDVEKYEALHQAKADARPAGRGFGFNPEAVARFQAKAQNQAPDSIPAMMKPGEFVLPPDTVHAMGGKEALQGMVDATHTAAPEAALVPRGFHPQLFFAQGGAVDDEAQGKANYTPSTPTPTSAPAPAAGSLGSSKLGGAYGMGAAVRSALGADTPSSTPSVAAADASPFNTGAIGQSGGVSAFGRGLAGGPVQPPAPAPAATPKPASPPGYGQYNQGQTMGPPDLSKLPASTPAPAPAPISQGQQPSYGPIGDRTTMTNAQAAIMNPAGRVTATRGANGTMEFSGGNVSGQVSYNDPSGKALPGGGINGKGFSGFDVAPAGANVALGPNGSYAYGTNGAAQGGQPGAAAAPAPGFGMRPFMEAAPTSPAPAPGPGLGMGPLMEREFQSGGATAPAPAPSRGFGMGPLMAEQSPAGTTQGDQPSARGFGFNTPGSGPVEPGSFTGGYSGVIGSPINNGLMGSRTPEQQRRDAEVSANSIMNDGGRFDLHKGVSPARQALQALDAQGLANIRAQGDLQQEGMRQAGGLQREGLQQQGANQRAALSTSVDQQKLGIEGRKAASEIEARGYDNQAAQQVAQLRNVLVDPKATPEQKKQAQQAMQTITGKYDSAKNRFLTVGGESRVVDGQTVKDPQHVFDTETGQWMKPPGSGEQPQFKVGEVYVNGKGERARRTAMGWEPA